MRPHQVSRRFSRTIQTVSTDLHWNLSQSYGASPAIWDQTASPATRHRWTRPAQPDMKDGKGQSLPKIVTFYC